MCKHLKACKHCSPSHTVKAGKQEGLGAQWLCHWNPTCLDIHCWLLLYLSPSTCKLGTPALLDSCDVVGFISLTVARWPEHGKALNQDSESTKSFLPNPNVRGGRSCYRRKTYWVLKKTDTESFLYEATTPAQNNWGQVVEVNECHPTDSKELWIRLLRSKQVHTWASCEQMCFSLENTTYIQLYQLQILKRKFF